MNMKKITESLRLKGYKVSVFEEKGDVITYLNKKIHNEIVGLGDSDTILSMRLFESLSEHNQVFDPQKAKNEKAFIEIAKKCLTTNIYIASVNGIAETGEMVNIDGTGNRIAGSLFGHQKVYFVVGTNKIVPTLEEAIWRARNIAAPLNAKRLGLRTPCAIEGKRCFNCNSPERICNGLMIYLKKMDNIEVEVIFINKQLGF